MARMGKWVICIIMLVASINCQAQKEDLAVMDSIAQADSRILFGDSVATASDTTSIVVKKKEKKPARDWATWKPNPQRALWLALVLPGAGQIYNRKFWKLPIIYGGFLGCTYALLWNQQMYKDYSQAYLDITDNDPNTQSYLDMLPPRYDITGKEDRFRTIFKNRKDRYRRYRDLSAFAFIGVYIISVIDAYVDAQLSHFDISPDLSLHLAPSVINSQHGSKQTSSYGMGIGLHF